MNTCRYCGHDLKSKRSREHVLPSSLGGHARIDGVCQDCNNRELSKLDKVLSTSPPLAMVNSFADGRLSDCVFATSDDKPRLLLDARLYPSSFSIAAATQLVMHADSRQWIISSDLLAQGGMSGIVEHLNHIVKSVRAQRLPVKKNRVHLQRVCRTHLDDYRYPPRIVVCGEVNPSRKDNSLLVRFRNPRDLRIVAHGIASLGSYANNPSKTLSTVHLTHDSRVAIQFQHDLAIRGLYKCALNCLAFACTRTPIDLERFPVQFGKVVGSIGLSQQDLFDSSFLAWRPNTLGLNSMDQHVVQLSHHDGSWNVHTIWFRGACQSLVSFDGPSREVWRSARIRFPTHGTGELQHNTLFIPPTGNPEWAAYALLDPSLNRGVGHSGIQPSYVASNGEETKGPYIAHSVSDGAS